jgi:hypothetical protein
MEEASRCAALGPGRVAWCPSAEDFVWSLVALGADAASLMLLLDPTLAMTPLGAHEIAQCAATYGGSLDSPSLVWERCTVLRAHPDRTAVDVRIEEDGDEIAGVPVKFVRLWRNAGAALGALRRLDGLRFALSCARRGVGSSSDIEVRTLVGTLALATLLDMDRRTGVAVCPGDAPRAAFFAARAAALDEGGCSFIYRYMLRESCSQFDSLPLTSLTSSTKHAARGRRWSPSPRRSSRRGASATSCARA